MECAKVSLEEIAALIQNDSLDPISDDVARALFRQWKQSNDLSLGDLFRAVESRGREAAKREWLLSEWN